MGSYWFAVLTGSYLSQSVRSSGDDPDPEVNVNAVRVIVQNTRKLKRKT